MSVPQSYHLTPPKITDSESNFLVSTLNQFQRQQQKFTSSTAIPNHQQQQRLFNSACNAFPLFRQRASLPCLPSFTSSSCCFPLTSQQDCCYNFNRSYFTSNLIHRGIARSQSTGFPFVQSGSATSALSHATSFPHFFYRCDI